MIGEGVGYLLLLLFGWPLQDKLHELVSASPHSNRTNQTPAEYSILLSLLL